MQNKTEGGSGLLVLILTFGVFSILNTEMGVIGMLPLIADTFQVSVPQAGWTVTVFALVIAVCGPITPMLFSRFDRKTVMLSALGVFIISNVVSMFTESFAVLLVSRAVPAIFHPVYVSMAFTVAATSVAKEDAPKAVAKVFIGVSAGMVLSSRRQLYCQRNVLRYGNVFLCRRERYGVFGYHRLHSVHTGDRQTFLWGTIACAEKARSLVCRERRCFHKRRRIRLFQLSFGLSQECYTIAVYHYQHCSLHLWSGEYRGKCPCRQTACR